MQQNYTENFCSHGHSVMEMVVRDRKKRNRILQGHFPLSSSSQNACTYLEAFCGDRLDLSLADFIVSHLQMLQMVPLSSVKTFLANLFWPSIVCQTKGIIVT